MIKITNQDIRSLASNRTTYLRGLDYFNRGMVRELEYSLEDNILYARVRGNDDYQIQIYLDQNYGINEAECTCSAYYEYLGYCKHIIAALLEAKKKYGHGDDKNFLERIDFPTLPDDDWSEGSFSISRELISNMLKNTKTETTGVKEDINLKVTLIKSNSIYSQPTIELEIGTSRMYVVKNIGKFLECMLNKRDLIFGKQFTYSPVNQQFNPYDQALIDLLLEIYNDERGFNTGNYYSSGSKKSMSLNASQFKRLLGIAGKMKVAYWKREDNSQPIKLKVNYNQLPISVKLYQGEKSTQLELDRESMVYPATAANDVFISGDKFYIPSREEADIIMPLIQAYSKTLYKPITLSDEDSAIFITEIAPVLRKSYNVLISNELSERLQVEPLTSAIWLDKSSSGISAKISFKYGEREFDPFNSSVAVKKDSRFIVREKGKEAQLLDYLKNCGFSRKKNEMVLLDEEKIYDFLSEKVSSITELSEVYYSEALNHMKISKPPRIRGSVKIEDGMDLLTLSFDLEGINESELSGFLAALKEKKRFFRLKNGDFISTDNQEALAAAKLIEQLELSGGNVNKKTAMLPKYRALYLDTAIKEYGSHHFAVNTTFREMVKRVKEPAELDFEVPESLDGIMREYQKAGFKWLKSLSYYGFGGILADDMGLGKTLQAIALVISDYQLVQQPSLIIVPTSLLYNWQEEITKFASTFPVTVLDGTKQERKRLFERIPQSAFVITSYPLIRRDIEEIKKFTFSYCFVDEAQHIKNPDTINARSVKKVNARRFFALTGTPIENSLTELWSIFDFLMPKYLYTHNKFRSTFEIPIVKNGDKSALNDLRRHIDPFILRRLKKDVLSELPEKIETKLLCDMTKEQKMVYISYLSKARSEFEDEINSTGFNKSQFKILALLTRLRQICCHPSTFLEDYRGGSGKLDLLEEVVSDSIQGGHRILVFSQFTSILEIIKKMFIKNNISYSVIDGKTPSEERMKLVNAFNSGSTQVFLISLKAGGTGLNLTGADTVIHFDPWWNPAVEDQATDRAHRLGQKNRVQVIRLVTLGTIEEKILLLQQKKRLLVDSVIKPGESLLGKMTLDEVRNLFM